MSDHDEETQPETDKSVFPFQGFMTRGDSLVGQVAEAFIGRSKRVSFHSLAEPLGQSYLGNEVWVSMDDSIP